MKARTKAWIGSVLLLSLFTAGIVVAEQTPEQTPAPPQIPGATQPPPQNPPPPDPTNPDDPRYKLAVDVELVNVIATVLDENGKHMEGLKIDDFKVFENGEEQKVSFFSHDLRIPISVGVLVDNSGSMKHKLQQALQTIREVAQALSPQDQMFVVTFNSDVVLRQPFTSSPQDLQKALKDLKSGGETAAYDAINLALQEMKRAKHNKKILILVTDGFDTKSKINAIQAEELLKRSQVLVYAIGIDDDENDPYVLRREKYHIYHYMLNKLTNGSGGRTYRMYTGRMYALQSVAQSLLDELHQQYTLGYYPSGTRESNTWRQVEVKVGKPGSQIRHKVGYYVSQPGQ